MDAGLSFIMANHAKVKADDLVYDPFVGTGEEMSEHIECFLIQPFMSLDTNSDSNIWLDEPHFKRAVFMWKVIFSNIAFDQLTY